MRLPMYCAMIVLLILIACYPQKALAVYRIEIVVKEDNELDGIIRGYLVRSLRELKNVAITNLEPDYKIQCVAAACTLEGDVPGCAISIAVLSNLGTLAAVDSYYTSGKKVEAEALYDWLDHYNLVCQYIFVTPRARLQQTCSEFVAHFDGRELDEIESHLIDSIHSRVYEERHPKEGP
jgi:hypothetical protein